MPRFLVALLALCTMLFAAPAAVAAQAPAVASEFGSVTPSYTSGTVVPRDGEGPALIKDGFGLNPPTLTVNAGGVVTITLGTTADAFVAWLGMRPLAVNAAADGVYSVALPADAALPASLGFRVDTSNETQLMSDGWTLELAAPAPPPAATPVPATQVPAAHGAYVPVSARLSGRRLAVTVSCPAETCARGVLTLRTPKLRIARVALPEGGRQTVRVTLTRAALRHLKRHRVRTLRGAVAAGAVSRVPLRS